MAHATTRKAGGCPRATPGWSLRPGTTAFGSDSLRSACCAATLRVYDWRMLAPSPDARAVVTARRTRRGAGHRIQANVGTTLIVTARREDVDRVGRPATWTSTVTERRASADLADPQNDRNFADELAARPISILRPTRVPRHSARSHRSILPGEKDAVQLTRGGARPTLAVPPGMIERKAAVSLTARRPAITGFYNATFHAATKAFRTSANLCAVSRRGPARTSRCWPWARFAPSYRMPPASPGREAGRTSCGSRTSTPPGTPSALSATRCASSGSDVSKAMSVASHHAPRAPPWRQSWVFTAGHFRRRRLCQRCRGISRGGVGDA